MSPLRVLGTLIAVLVLATRAGAFAATGADWLTYNGSYAGDRYSSLAEITPQNAARLKPVCAFQFGELGPMQSGPIVENGVMYVTTNDSTFALDAATCKQQWKSTYKPVGVPIGRVNRGVAMLGDRLFRGTSDSHLIALDRKTGKTLWDVTVSDSSDGSSVIQAPAAWDGKVFVGIAGGDLGAKGKVMGFSAADGKALWTFDVIPTGKQPGAKTWGNAASAATGGGATWTTFTVDTKTGSVFVPVGNPGPDFSGDYRPGINLYTCSIVVLDANTGKLRWYWQMIPHDVHDWDVAAAPALFTGGNGKPYIAVGGKDGYLYMLDGASHRVLSKTPITTIFNVDAPLTAAGTRFCPVLGGVEWNGPAYSPVTKLTYVGTNDWCTTIKLGEVRFVRGKSFLGSANGYGEKDPTLSGWLTAVDPLTGKIAWKYHAATPVLAGVTPTEGGVVFTGEMGGEFHAFDAASGKLLYSFNTGGSVVGGVATYSVNGKQYVAAVSGNQSRTAFPGGGSPSLFIFSL